MQVNRRRLRELRDLVNTYPGEPPEVGTELARFLVIRSTGYVEHTFETCIKSFALAHSHPSVANHVVAGLFRGRNARSETLLDRISELSDSWRVRLESFLGEDDGRTRRELDFMVDRRNKIAHGQNETVNRGKAIDLADVALDVGAELIEIIDPR